MEIDPDNNNSIEKTYIYTNSQILAQHNGDHTDSRYFYLHDRLGSVRLIIDSSANVKNRYTYKPFGDVFTAETEETIGNPFGFTGQWYDAEIGEYFLLARMYDPHINRFTGRDPVFGEFEQPLTLHKYLYCINDSVNLLDPWGLRYWTPEETWEFINDEVIPYVEDRGPILGPSEAFGLRGGRYDIKVLYPRDDFGIAEGVQMSASEFGNYLAAYTCTYLYGSYGDWVARIGGEWFSRRQYGEPDDIRSRYYISTGFLQAREDGGYHGGSAEVINAKRTLHEYIVEILTTGEKYDQDSGDYLTLSDAQIQQELQNFNYFWNY